MRNMHASIHPFSPAYPIQCHKGAETPLSCHRARSGVHLDKSPVWCRANSTGQTTRNAHIYTYGINLESPLNTSSSQSSWRDHTQAPREHANSTQAAGCCRGQHCDFTAGEAGGFESSSQLQHFCVEFACM